MSKLEMLQLVALKRDLPEHGLQAGDVGTVVELMGGGKFVFVEFIEVSGDTRALVDLPASDFRSLKPTEMLTTRA